MYSQRKPPTRMERVNIARSHMLNDQPFYGVPAHKLVLIEDSTLKPPTAATDGTRLLFHPTFIDGKTDKQLQFVVAHEALHCMMKHPYRLGTRDHDTWNVACDFNINLTLKDAGLEVPPDAMISEAWRDPKTGFPLAAEIIYARIFKPGPRPVPNPGNTRMIAPPETPPEPEQEMDESDWDLEAIAAEAASNRHGKGPGRGGDMVRQSRSPREDWREVLQEWVQATVPSDYTWRKPDRRYLSHGLYMPGIEKDGAPPFGIIVDTSGSVDDATIAVVNKAVSDINRLVQPERIDVVYCDTRVMGTESFGPDDDVVLKVPRGGGTNMNPALAHFNALPEPPAAVLVITDLYMPPITPKNVPTSYDVLWAITPGSSETSGPFGRSIRIDPYDGR